MINHGTISGGYGGSNVDQQAGVGGIGVDLQAGGTLLNTGMIQGGFGGTNNYYLYAGGIAVDFSAAGTLVNSGTIQGAFTEDAVRFEAGGAVRNTGNILGGVDAGAVHLVSGGTLTNTGTIAGGQGRTFEGGDAGGVGIVAVSATIDNHSTIAGGAGGSTFHPGSNAGIGAAGIMSSGGSVTNSGSISGGVGGDEKGMARGLAGAGGAGVMLDGASFTNTGTITGGAGGAQPHEPDAAGGAGILINGGVLFDSGAVIGGAGGTQGDAIQFGNTAASLTITARATFSGNIAANSSTNDTLALAGTAGTLSGLGTTVTGFTTIAAEAGSHWTLVGTVSGHGALTIGTGAALILQGPATIATIAFAPAGDALLRMETTGQITGSIAGFGTGDVIDLRTIQAKSFAYENGTLTLLDASHTVLDTLTFAGDYTEANFALRYDGVSGTGINYVATGQAPPPDFRFFPHVHDPCGRTQIRPEPSLHFENRQLGEGSLYFPEASHQAVS